MSARSADTASALLVAASTTTPITHKPRAFSSSNHHLHHHPADADDRTTTDGDDNLVGAVDQLLSSGVRRGLDVDDGFDLCRSTWKSVETMARALAVGQSVVSTISRCYSLPEKGRNSGARGAAAAAVRRSARQAGTEVMHSSLLSGRLATEALAIFRRYVSVFAPVGQNGLRMIDHGRHLWI